MSPHFVGIGPPRTGSTTLWACLRLHPDIEIPAAKELHWFDQPDWNPQSIKRYERNWTSNLVRGEITTDYCLHLDRILSVYPTVKLIMTVRDPVERFLSAIAMSYKRNAADVISKEDYQQQVESHLLEGVYHSDTDHQLRLGFYSQLVKQVDPAQLLTVSFEDLANRQTEVMVEISDFLGVRPFRNIPYQHENPSTWRFDFSDEFLNSLKTYYASN